MVSPGLGVPAVSRAEVHRNLFPRNGQKEPPGRDHSTFSSMDQIKKLYMFLSLHHAAVAAPWLSPLLFC